MTSTAWKILANFICPAISQVWLEMLNFRMSFRLVSPSNPPVLNMSLKLIISTKYHKYNKRMFSPNTNMLLSNTADLRPYLLDGRGVINSQVPVSSDRSRTSVDFRLKSLSFLPPVTRRTCITEFRFVLNIKYNPHVVSLIIQIGSTGVFVSANIELSYRCHPSWVESGNKLQSIVVIITYIASSNDEFKTANCDATRIAVLYY